MLTARIRTDVHSHRDAPRTDRCSELSVRIQFPSTPATTIFPIGSHKHCSVIPKIDSRNHSTLNGFGTSHGYSMVSPHSRCVGTLPFRLRAAGRNTKTVGRSIRTPTPDVTMRRRRRDRSPTLSPENNIRYQVDKKRKVVQPRDNGSSIEFPVFFRLIYCAKAVLPMLHITIRPGLPKVGRNGSEE